MFNFIAFSGFFLLILAFVIFLTIVWIWSIVDCVSSNRSGLEKVMWILVIVFLNILGSILYFLLKDNVGDMDNTSKTKGQSDDKKKVLTRDSENTIIAGVCSGLAKHLNIDPTIIRLIWLVFTIFSVGMGVLIYLIAAIIIPKDVDIDDKRSKHKKKDNSRNNVLIFSVTAILVVLILSILIVALVAMTNYHDNSQTYVNNRASQVITPLLHAPEKNVMDYIKTHDNFISYNGSSLKCQKVELIEDERCMEKVDPYAMTLYDHCYEVNCNFTSGLSNIDGFNIKALVIGDLIKEIEFDKYELNNEGNLNHTINNISNFQDCVDAGFEVLYPDCEGCFEQCIDDKENIFTNNN